MQTVETNASEGLLTPEMRHYLGQSWLTEPLLYDVVRAFMDEFGLTRRQAGKLIWQWIVETQ
jgi:hypothetical protein